MRCPEVLKQPYHLLSLPLSFTAKQFNTAESMQKSELNVVMVRLLCSLLYSCRESQASNSFALGSHDIRSFLGTWCVLNSCFTLHTPHDMFQEPASTRSKTSTQSSISFRSTVITRHAFMHYNGIKMDFHSECLYLTDRHRPDLLGRDERGVPRQDRLEEARDRYGHQALS